MECGRLYDSNFKKIADLVLEYQPGLKNQLIVRSYLDANGTITNDINISVIENKYLTEVILPIKNTGIEPLPQHNLYLIDSRYYDSEGSYYGDEVEEKEYTEYLPEGYLLFKRKNKIGLLYKSEMLLEPDYTEIKHLSSITNGIEIFQLNKENLNRVITTLQSAVINESNKYTHIEEYGKLLIGVNNEIKQILVISSDGNIEIKGTYPLVYDFIFELLPFPRIICGLDLKNNSADLYSEFPDFQTTTTITINSGSEESVKNSVVKLLIENLIIDSKY